MTKKNFKDLVSNETSKVHERIAFLRANKTWLMKSMRIAVTILKVLRERNITQNTLAASLNVTPQYVNKILKGNENLTLETITKIEEILKIKLIAVEVYTTQVETLKPQGLPTSINRTNYKPITTENKAKVRDSFKTTGVNKDFAFAA